MKETTEFESINSMNDVNNVLARHGVQAVDRNTLQCVFNQHGRDKIIRALTKADNNDHARDFLRNAFPVASLTAAANEPDGRFSQAAQSTQGANDDSQKQSQHRQFRSLHVYARNKAALTFSEDTTRSGEYPTIRLEAAFATQDGRGFDWSNKTAIQVTRNELPEVVAVLAGVKSSCEFKNHGENSNKGYYLEIQNDGKVFCKVFGGDNGGVKAVPIFPADRFHVSMLATEQLKRMVAMDSDSDNANLMLAMVKQCFGGH